MKNYQWLVVIAASLALTSAAAQEAELDLTDLENPHLCGFAAEKQIPISNHGRKYTGKIAFGLARARHPEGPWEKYSHNPVFEPTDKVRDFDGIFLQHACPVKVDDQWRLDCNGWSLNSKAKNSIGAEYAIGLAFASD